MFPLKKIFILPAGIVYLMLATGCASMTPPPAGPSVAVTPSRNTDIEMYCRSVADKAAQEARNANVTQEVVGTIAGVALGAVVGGLASTPGHVYAGHSRFVGYDRFGQGVYARPYYYQPGHDLAGAGAVLGGATGAALAQNGQRNPQAVYDQAYMECRQMHDPPPRTRGRR